MNPNDKVVDDFRKDDDGNIIAHEEITFES